MITNVEIGDQLMAIKVDESLGDYEAGEIITVVGSSKFEAYLQDGEIEIEALTTSMFADANRALFVHVDTITSGLNGKLGVARPILETRKVGKNRVELVDKGFPDALWEIARLMTHAQEVKGYKDHDWKNLPIEVFPAAASRHRMKHNMGEIFDDEFEGLDMRHKVNEAFNVLAELQLMLTK